ncbi:MAG TPA: hypothetical protein VGN72_05190 [Tepidisphaeraceae bacterium]|nr:hypothetical protein [Tepidisphaeraceae bacterium]
MKCRACGEVFAVVQNADQSDDAPDMTADALEGLAAPAAPRGLTGARAGRPVPQAPANPFDMSDDGFDADDANLRAPRPNTLPAYAGAAPIDRFLPILLVLLSLGWTCAEAMNGNEMGLMWVSGLRLGLFWLLYAIVVWPLVRLGGLKGNDKANVEPPESNTWRVFAAFSFPTALAYILWSINGGIGTFISGLAVGTAIGLAVHFILQRLTPNEGIKALPIVGGWYVGAVVAGTMFFIGLNFATQTVMTAAENAHEYATSPLGQYMPWSPPPARTDPRELALRSTPPTNPNSRASTRSTEAGVPASTDAQPAPVAPPDGTTVGGAIAAPVPATQPVASANAVPVQSDPPVNAEPKPRDGLFGGTSDADPMADLNASVDANTRTVPGVPVPQVKSPLVESSQPLADMGNFDSARFPQLPSRHVLVMHHVGLERDDLEIWDVVDTKKVGDATFRREAGMDPGYALSPSGKTLVRLANFPSLSMHVWSVDEQRVTRVIPLPPVLGTPYTVGFSEDNLVWIMWESAGLYGLQSWDITTGQRLRQLNLIDYVAGPNNFAISADGKTAAFLRTNRSEQAELSLMNLKTGIVTRRLLLAGMNLNPEAKPTGVAFSTDGTKVGLVLEHGAQGVLFVWNVADAKPTGQYILPDREVLPAGVRGRPANQLQWLPDGATVLFGGTTLIDATSGRIHGNLEMGNPSAQRMIDADTLLLALPDPKGANQFVGNRAGAQVPLQMHRVKLKLPTKTP